MTSDVELLRRYAEKNCQEAFAELVRRHLNMVYSTALRQVQGDTHLAQDVAQSVFTDLARKAAKLSSHPSLAGWLYTSAYFAGSKAARSEQRRRVREQEAQTMHDLLRVTPQEDWERVRPALDEAMHGLKEHERVAILKRYFENLPFGEIGVQLGLSEDTARKRVDRALIKLQTLLSKRGIATSAALASALSANAIQQAPAGLASMLTAASLSGAAIQSESFPMLLKLMATTKLQTTVFGIIVLASVLTPLTLQHKALARLHAQDDILRQQSNEVARLTSENQRLAGQIAQAKSVAPIAAVANPKALELLKLRNQVGQLRHTLQEMTNSSAADSLSPEEKLTRLRQHSSMQVARLKQWLNEHPTESIPELQASSEAYWADAANSLDKDNNFAAALSKLRFRTEATILNELRRAWQKYAADHSNPIPSSLTELRPYLGFPIDDAALQRYTLLPGRRLVTPLADLGDWVLTQAAPVNAALDMRMGISLTGQNNLLDEHITNRWTLLP